MREVLTILAICISLFGYVPYIIDSIKGKTKPHSFSWFTWSLISFLAFGIQLSKGGSSGSYINLFMGLICTVNFINGLRYGIKNIKLVDIIAFILAIIAVVLWLIVSQPLLSIILIVFIDSMSFIPTFRKSWNKPNEETIVTWILSVIKNILNIFALEVVSFTTAVYPIYSLIVNGMFVLMLFYRKKVNNLKT